MDMKIFQIITVMVFSSMLFFSCEKEEVELPVNDNNPILVDTKVEGNRWVLSDARIFIENLDNGERNVYDHFGSGKTESSMNAFGPGPTPVDSIVENYTTWFFQNGVFTLNDGESWEYTEYNDTYSIIGLPGGTARPIRVVEITETSLTVIIYEAYNSNNNTNYHYFTELTFIMAGTNCDNCQPDVPYGWTYSGIYEYDDSNSNSSSIVGTKWVVTRYLTSFGNFFPNDTLDFISDGRYTINGGPQRAYSLTGVIGNNMVSLNLYGFITLGGDYSGQVFNTFIDDGVVNNSNFHDMFNVNNTVVLWMERIQ